ncbi:Na/K ATPase alpha 1 isoform [Uncinocarpus reesii 1704]|uniref:Na/K ATPase alpha 1 isoform n=1 Tax=Uncinocarpus reesii (strain UAMH 1704) TaxID=336963 RepID=C4JLX6_UNCRE|nr:Na/K ATPase alpha 1 isoform [Uncinocarpus reesii 1704]EEP78988.1 Na/K ATPase alpha 1 isoform [Uncinocarpus reesii 1704]
MAVEKEARSRIRYADEEDAVRSDASRRSLHRRGSAASAISIRSAHSRVVAPEAALPITYRTLMTPGGIIGKDDGDRLAGISELDWHLISIDELVRRLSTSIVQGLSVEQAQRRISKYGKNAPTPPRTEWFRKIMGYFFGGFGVLLFIGCILVFIAWKPLGNPPALANLALAIVLGAVWVIQAGFNAWQDWSSSRVMASIKTMLPDDCMVIRDGATSLKSALDLVPGDVIKIKQGNKLPADVRLVEASPDLKFDRSILTGTATGICVSTGDSTIFGRIAGLTNKPRHEFTPIQKEILRFVLIIASFIATVVVLVIVLWATWLRRDHPDWINVSLLIVNCVSVGIAFVPEGLPVAVAMSLTIGANIMKKNKILCKSLATVETLGAVSVICSDKTGTLTKNEIYVTDTYAGGKEYKADDAKEGLFTGKLGEDISNRGLERLRVSGALCNAAEFDASTTKLPTGMMKIYGDPTDQAILRFSEMLSSVQDLRMNWKKVFEVAFNSKNKFMIRIMSPFEQGEKHHLPSDAELWIKGAPEVLLSRCDTLLRNDGTITHLSNADQATIESVKNRWSSEGKRVILIAQKTIHNDMSSVLKSAKAEKAVLDLARGDLTFIGLWGLIDPIVTGDFKLTAQAIARDCGIIRSAPALVHSIDNLNRSFEKPQTAVETEGLRSIAISGPELITLNESQWDQLCMYEEIVFARTTPEQKLRIVKEFQSRDHTVAMTGDGVNDAPALKAADVGVALGSGSDIAIEASDMVLLDSFSAIVEAVKYGRLTFDNLKKTIIYLLPAGSFSELSFSRACYGKRRSRGSPSTILIFDVYSLMLVELLHSHMRNLRWMFCFGPPRNAKKDRLVNVRFILHAYTFIGVYECLLSFVMAFWYMSRRGIPFSALVLKFGNWGPQYDPDYVAEVTNHASSIYFVNLVVIQFFNLLATRTRRLSIFQQPPLFNKQTQNPLLFAGMVWSLFIVFIFCYIPGIQDTVDTTSVPVEYFFIPVAFGIGILLLDETRKYFVRGSPNGILAKLAW